MLREVRVKNFAVVESVTAPFAPGLNVLTGETGAGKSILSTRSCSSAAPAPRPTSSAPMPTPPRWRRSSRCRRCGRRRARCWTRPGLGVDDSGDVVVRRELARSGRHRAFVNDSPVTVALLERLGDVLVEVHGQHEHQRLLEPAAPARAARSLRRCRGRVRARAERCTRSTGRRGRRPSGARGGARPRPARGPAALSGRASWTPPGCRSARRTRCARELRRLQHAERFNDRAGRVRGAPRRRAAVGLRAAGARGPRRSRTSRRLDPAFGAAGDAIEAARIQLERGAGRDPPPA